MEMSEQESFDKHKIVMMLSKEEIADLYIGANEAVNGLSRNNNSFILAFKEHFEKLHSLEAKLAVAEGEWKTYAKVSESLSEKLQVAVELLEESQDGYDEHMHSCPYNQIDGICNCGVSSWRLKRKTFIEKIKAK